MQTIKIGLTGWQTTLRTSWRNTCLFTQWFDSLKLKFKTCPYATDSLSNTPSSLAQIAPILKVSLPLSDPELLTVESDGKHSAVAVHFHSAFRLCVHPWDFSSGLLSWFIIRTVLPCSAPSHCMYYSFTFHSSSKEFWSFPVFAVNIRCFLLRIKLQSASPITYLQSFFLSEVGMA